MIIDEGMLFKMGDWRLIEDGQSMIGCRFKDVIFVQNEVKAKKLGKNWCFIDSLILLKISSDQT